MTKYSIMQGEYRDTFTIETDPNRNQGIIKPTKVRRLAILNPSWAVEFTASKGRAWRLILSHRPLTRIFFVQLRAMCSWKL